MENKILDAVAQLIDKYGLKKFTVDEVATTLHISKKTIYQHFSGKNEMIQAYFKANIDSDQKATANAIQTAENFHDKIYALVHTSRRYRLSVEVMDEARQFYPAEWEKIKDLKQYKLNVLEKLLIQAAADGLLRSDIKFGILATMLERVSEVFLDTEFLLNNGLKATQAIDAALDIIMYGIMEEDKKIDG